MIIGKSKNNSLDQQIQENTDNIEILARYIKQLFNTKAELDADSTTVDVSDILDFIEGTKEGLLITEEGLLFKIVTVADDIAYLQYWATLPKGEKGDTGDKGDKGNTGETGATGEKALVYTEIISTQNLILPPLPDNKFNRTPNINDTFLAFVSDTTLSVNAKFVAVCKVIHYDAGEDAWDCTGSYSRIPSGAQGEQGETGEQGIGFNNTTMMNLSKSTPAVTVDSDGITVNNDAEITTDGGTFEPQTEIKLPIKAGVGMSIDADQEAEHALVNIDLTGGTAGDVLKINSAGTGVEWGSGGGTKKYLHRIMDQESGGFNNIMITFDFVDTVATPYTNRNDIMDKLLEVYGENKRIPVFAMYKEINTDRLVLANYGLINSSGAIIREKFYSQKTTEGNYGFSYSSGSGGLWGSGMSFDTLRDTVIEL